MSFTTLKTGDFHVNPESVNLDEALQNAIEESQPSAADLGITVGTEGDTFLSVRVDKNICTKALGLLLDNAIKYNKEGGAVELGVSVDESLREEMDVPDSGIASG